MLKMMPRILENLVHRPATRDYPRTARQPFAATRGRLTNDIAQCNCCGACAVKCPSGAIRVDRHEARWVFDPYLCVGCGVCVEVCPQDSLKQVPDNGPPAAGKTLVVLQGTPRAEA